jgi:hypothetical protein
LVLTARSSVARPDAHVPPASPLVALYAARVVRALIFIVITVVEMDI